jgi:hypothetical protein
MAVALPFFLFGTVCGSKNTFSTKIGKYFCKIPLLKMYVPSIGIIGIIISTQSDSNSNSKQTFNVEKEKKKK